MAVEDNMREGFVYSHVCKSLETIYSEDVAWADSCLIEDLEISEIKLNSLNGALLEILGSESEALGSSAVDDENLLGETDYMIIHSSEEAESARSPERTANDPILINQGDVEMSNDIPVDKDTDTLPSQTYLNNPFLPNFKDESAREVEITDLALDFEFPVTEMESYENIFRVWDLDIPAAEDVFQERLNKAFENSLQSIPSTLDASGAWNELKHEPLDGLIAGMADLSLTQNSGQSILH